MMKNSIHGHLLITSLLVFHNPRICISLSQWPHAHESEGKEMLPRTLCFILRLSKSESLIQAIKIFLAFIECSVQTKPSPYITQKFFFYLFAPFHVHLSGGFCFPHSELQQHVYSLSRLQLSLEKINN